MAINKKLKFSHVLAHLMCLDHVQGLACWFTEKKNSDFKEVDIPFPYKDFYLLVKECDKRDEISNSESKDWNIVWDKDWDHLLSN